MNTAVKPRPARHQIFGNIWLTVALAARAATQGSTSPCALILHDGGLLEALDPSHPDYASSVTLPGFACMISTGSHPYRIASRLRAAAERVGITQGIAGDCALS